MGKGQARAQHSAMAAVECEQFIRRPVVQKPLHTPLNVSSHPGCAEPLAFEAEIGDLIEWIDNAESRIELETIDYKNFIIDPHVLRPPVPRAPPRGRQSGPPRAIEAT